jgi:hypothetical protein
MEWQLLGSSEVSVTSLPHNTKSGFLWQRENGQLSPTAGLLLRCSLDNATAPTPVTFTPSFWPSASGEMVTFPLLGFQTRRNFGVRSWPRSDVIDLLALGSNSDKLHRLSTGLKVVACATKEFLFHSRNIHSNRIFPFVYKDLWVAFDTRLWQFLITSTEVFKSRSVNFI